MTAFIAFRNIHSFIQLLEVWKIKPLVFHFKHKLNGCGAAKRSPIVCLDVDSSFVGDWVGGCLGGWGVSPVGAGRLSWGKRWNWTLCSVCLCSDTISHDHLGWASEENPQKIGSNRFLIYKCVKHQSIIGDTLTWLCAHIKTEYFSSRDQKIMLWQPERLCFSDPTKPSPTLTNDLCFGLFINQRPRYYFSFARSSIVVKNSSMSQTNQYVTSVHDQEHYSLFKPLIKGWV